MPNTVKILLTIPIVPAPAPPPFTGPLESTVEPCTVGVPFEQQFAQVTGGTPPYNPPTVASDSPKPLPAGLSLVIDNNGVLSLIGTPQLPGTTKVLVDIADSTKN